MSEVRLGLGAIMSDDIETMNIDNHCLTGNVHGP